MPVRLLALTTSGDQRSAACLVGAEVVAQGDGFGARSHAEHLLPLIATTLADVGWSWSQIDIIACDVGPGSFTGVRVGVAAARALALALDRPVVAVSALHALLGTDRATDVPVLAAIDARRGGLYVSLRQAGEAPGHRPEPAIWRMANIASELQRLALGQDLHVVGSGADPVAAAWPHAQARHAGLDATLIASAARERLEDGEQPGLGCTLHPLYLRSADATPQAA